MPPNPPISSSKLLNYGNTYAIIKINETIKNLIKYINILTAVNNLNSFSATISLDKIKPIFMFMAFSII